MAGICNSKTASTIRPAIMIKMFLFSMQRSVPELDKSKINGFKEKAQSF
jgi:hypothetical protein